MIILRGFAILVGMAIIAAMAHVVTMMAGGYEATIAPLIWAAAAGLCLGSICVGVAFSEGRWVLAIVLFLALGAGEGDAILQTSEATIAARDAVVAPIRDADRARDEATKRVADAVKAKADADSAAIENAPLPGCRRECRILLEGAKSDAQDELLAARAALAALPEPRSADPLADRLHIDATTLDLIAAGLRCFAINGLGAALIAFGAHRRRKLEERKLAARAVSEMPRKAVIREAEHAAQFAVEALTPAAEHEADLLTLHDAYRGWCDSKGIEPLSAARIGAVLANLFDGTGITIADRDGRRVAIGIAVNGAVKRLSDPRFRHHGEARGDIAAHCRGGFRQGTTQRG